MSIEKNCLPDRIDTVTEKIEYVKSCYGIIGENGNLFDWLISELLPKETLKEKISEILYKNQVTMYSRGSCGELGDSCQAIISDYFTIISEEIYNEITNKL